MKANGAVYISACCGSFVLPRQEDAEGSRTRQKEAEGGKWRQDEAEGGRRKLKEAGKGGNGTERRHHLTMLTGPHRVDPHPELS